MDENQNNKRVQVNIKSAKVAEMLETQSGLLGFDKKTTAEKLIEKGARYDSEVAMLKRQLKEKELKEAELLEKAKFHGVDLLVSTDQMTSAKVSTALAGIEADKNAKLVVELEKALSDRTTELELSKKSAKKLKKQLKKELKAPLREGIGMLKSSVADGTLMEVLSGMGIIRTPAQTHQLGGADDLSPEERAFIQNINNDFGAEGMQKLNTILPVFIKEQAFFNEVYQKCKAIINNLNQQQNA